MTATRMKLPKTVCFSLHGVWLCNILLLVSGLSSGLEIGCGSPGEDWRTCGPCFCYFTEMSTRACCTGPTITDVPFNLPFNITHLTLVQTGIVQMRGENLHGHDFNTSKLCRYPQLNILSVRDNQALQSLHQGTFDMSCDDHDTISPITFLSITFSPLLTNIEMGTFGSFPSLKYLHITHCGIDRVPDWGLFTANLKVSENRGYLDELNLANNKIQFIHRNAFKFGSGIQIAHLSLEDNEIQYLDGGAFTGAEIRYLHLRRNHKLTYIHPDAFKGVQMLDNIDLSQSSIEALPTTGLKKVQNLTLQEVPTLKIFPSVLLTFSSIQEAHLTYAYHCCAFAFPDLQNIALYEELQRSVEENCPSSDKSLGKIDVDVGSTTPMSMFMDSFIPPGTRRKRRSQPLPHWLTKIWNTQHKPRVKRDNFQNEPSLDGWIGNMSEAVTLWPIDNGVWLRTTIDPSKNYSATVDCGLGHVVELVKRTKCTPQPDAMNPCEDVMGHQWLRVVVWFVVTAALFGNLLVLLVTLLSRFKLTVTKFLMCNLSFADFCLGFYLLILAAYDIRTMGVYFSSAIPWQYEGGCGAAGFLAVFSTCLSIFTLTIITMERWYAISHAIHLTKRLHMRQACYIMLGGWLYSLLMAVLPLVGVSSYSRTSTCLPMDTIHVTGKVYVFLLLIINAGAFIVICTCYIDMFRKVSGNNNAAGSGDAIIAKRMAILVFTDFACLFPMAFFGLTAAAGRPLITVTDSKILLVFFFPLNSCANPFLYVIFTRQFKKDLFGLLSGRCGIFEKKATRYRATFTSTPLSSTHSRNSSGNPHWIHRSSAASALTALLSSNHSSSKSNSSSSPKCASKRSPQNVKKPNQQAPRKATKPELDVDVADKKESRKLSMVPEASHVPEDNDDIVAELGFEPKTGEHPRSRTVRSASEYSESTPLSKGNSFESQSTGFYKGYSFDYERFDKRKPSQSTSLSSNTDTSILSDSSVPDTPFQPPIEEKEDENIFNTESENRMIGSTEKNFPTNKLGNVNEPQNNMVSGNKCAYFSDKQKTQSINEPEGESKITQEMSGTYTMDKPTKRVNRPTPERDSGLPSPELDIQDEDIGVAH